MSSAAKTPDYTKMSSGEMVHMLGMDGQKWTEAAIQHGLIREDQRDWAFGWFCNAIMAGYDKARGGGPINGDHAQWLADHARALTEAQP